MSRDPVKISSSTGGGVPTSVETTTERIPIPCDYFQGDKDRKSGFELGIPAQVKVKTEPIRLVQDKRSEFVTQCAVRFHTCDLFVCTNYFAVHMWGR